MNIVASSESERSTSRSSASSIAAVRASAAPAADVTNTTGTIDAGRLSSIAATVLVPPGVCGTSGAFACSSRDSGVETSPTVAIWYSFHSSWTCASAGLASFGLVISDATLIDRLRQLVDVRPDGAAEHLGERLEPRLKSGDRFRRRRAHRGIHRQPVQPRVDLFTERKPGIHVDVGSARKCRNAVDGV